MSGPRKTPEKRQADLDSAWERLAASVQSMRESGGWQAWLAMAAKLPNYSLNNQLLILAQRPDATMVAGFGAWKELNRAVMKGERGLRILAPSTRKVDVLDPTGAPVRSADGTPERRDRLVGFRVVSVFDVSQTDGEPIPEGPKVALLDGEAPPGLWDALVDQVNAAGFTVHRVPNAADLSGANGVTDFTSRTVTVRADVSAAQAVKTLGHELAHVMLHEPTPDSRIIRCRGEAEVEAESVAFIVASHAALDTSDYSFGYVASWSAQADDNVLTKVATRVRSAAATIIERLPAQVPAPAPAAARAPLVWQPSPALPAPAVSPANIAAAPSAFA